ncbi:MAG TPA: hypothetical protein DE060_16810 [Lentisphaeria bacterium]|nr:hypothetical protein [Lentisphaeria bacterium]HCG50853.1 hypothetical protein [Lentisphaeria bacterium]
MSLLYLLIRGENDFYAWKRKKFDFFLQDAKELTLPPRRQRGSGMMKAPNHNMVQSVDLLQSNDKWGRRRRNLH